MGEGEGGGQKKKVGTNATKDGWTGIGGHREEKERTRAKVVRDATG